ncbi:MAG TPA: phosphatidate cytidylyltransferase [Bacillota bacterium]|jgi:phosphatidate cytidylyltransferase|nr:phosphatidate cytidylyltransferase [Fastidiosipila sp.]HPX93807.1 phosphatidate cytidylyltransferase [Bacillota bacterium]HQB81632.1 phosphatidate cytidylyltransferase [Bacillota bacterium]
MKKIDELTVRVITAAIYVGIMIVFIVPGLWAPVVPLVLLAAVAFLSAFEKGQAVRLRLPQVTPLPAAVTSVLLGLLSFLGISRGSFLRGIAWTLDPSVNTLIAPKIFGYFALLALFILPMISLIQMWRKGVELLPSTLAMTAIVFSSAVPLAASVALLYGCRYGWHWFVLAILTAWVSDTCAYFAGRFLGRMRFAPAISPRKTWEGTMGGVVGTIALYLIYFPLVIGKRTGYATGASFAFATVAAVLMSLSASLGDLQSSALKRWCGIKDFGALLPGHGGISDRFDSIFTALPAMLLLAILAGAIL